VSKYNLLPHEVVLLKDAGVFRGMSSTSELTLTNLNLVIEKKGPYGKSKGLQTFPVSQIKVYDGQAQAQMSRTVRGLVLSVYFVNSEEEFRFVSGGKKKIQAWIDKINEAVTGQPAPEAPSFVLSPFEQVAEDFKDALETFKSPFKSKLGPAPEAPVRVTAACNSCGALVSGTKGRAITCSYCHTAQQL